MSHLRPEDMTERRRRAACRRGRHSYGPDQHIGAGIIRRVCDVCSSVNIDLTEVELTAPVLKSGDNIIKLAADRR